MSQIYPKIESSEKVVDSRQMLLDRDDANRTNNSGQTAPANVTPNDIGMTWFNTQDGLMYNLVSVEEDGSNPVWQKMANFNSFNVMNLGVLQEEALFVDLEGPACDAKADMLVLVEHTMLPTENYEITQDGTRVTFLQPIEAGLHLELRWFTKVIIARDGKTFVPSLVDGVLSWENDGGLPNPEPFDFNAAQAGVVAEGNKQVSRVQQSGEDALSSISNAKNDFNTNATNKTNKFNTNATNKTTSFNSNYTSKLNSFNTNATQKQAAVDASTEEARKWAVGTISEQPAGSSKYWAEEAEKSAASVDVDNIVNRTDAQSIDGDKTIIKRTLFNDEIILADIQGITPDNPPSVSKAIGTLRWIVGATKGATGGYGDGQELFRIQPVINPEGYFSVTSSYMYGDGQKPAILAFGCAADGSNSFFNILGRNVLTLEKPSTRYDNIPVQANDTTYTAPANGWFVARGDGNGANGQIYLNRIDGTDGIIGSTCIMVDNSWKSIPAAPIPVKKGDVVKLIYVRATVTTFRFYYDEGVK